MSRLFLICVAVGLLSIAPELSRGQGKTADEKEIEAIRAVLAGQVTAWNEGSLEKFMDSYQKSDDIRYVSGKTEVRGWEPLLERYRKRYQNEGKEMGKLSFSDLDVKLLGADHAYVYGKFRLEMKGETPQGAFTLVLRRLPEGWRIIHDHTAAW